MFEAFRRDVGDGRGELSIRWTRDGPWTGSAKPGGCALRGQGRRRMRSCAVLSKARDRAAAMRARCDPDPAPVRDRRRRSDPRRSQRLARRGVHPRFAEMMGDYGGTGGSKCIKRGRSTTSSSTPTGHDSRPQRRRPHHWLQPEEVLGRLDDVPGIERHECVMRGFAVEVPPLRARSRGVAVGLRVSSPGCLRRGR